MHVKGEKIGHCLDKLGYGGALFATALGMGCCAPGIFAALASLVGSVGLGVLVRLDILMPILYASLAVTLAGLALSYRSHRQPYPLALGAIGGACLLYPFHMPLDLSIFFVLIYTGLGSLLAASLWWGTVLIGLASRSSCCPSPSPSSGAGMAVQ